MASTYYDSELTAAQIEAALEAISGVVTQANNGKVLGIENGTLAAKRVSDYKGTYQSKTVTPGASQQIVTPDSDYDALSSVVVNGDANLVAGNIKKYVEIFGIMGSYEGSGGGGGGNIAYSTSAPTSEQGSDGDTWCQYAVGATAVVSVSGGYNGGAVLSVTVDNTEVWHGVGSSPYNAYYTVTTDIPSSIVIAVTPPANHTDALLVSLTSAGDTRNITFMHNGPNSSYGYGNQSATETWSDVTYIVNLYIKQSGTWKTKGDGVVVS